MATRIWLGLVIVLTGFTFCNATSATTNIDRAAFDRNEKLIHANCKGHFDYGEKLLRLTPAALKGDCVVIPPVTLLLVENLVSRNKILAALQYPIQQIAGVKGSDTIAVNAARVDKAMKRYGLMVLGLNGTIAVPMAVKPVLLRVGDDDIQPYGMAPGMRFWTPSVFIVIGSYTFVGSDGVTRTVPELRYVGSADLHHIPYPQTFPS